MADPVKRSHPNDQGLIEIAPLPKVDLHRHLEGSLRLETLAEVALKFKLDLEPSIEKIRPLVQIVEDDLRSPGTLMAKFNTIRRFFRDVDTIRRFVHETIEDAAAESVKLLELRFTPAALQHESGMSSAEVIDAVIGAGQDAAERFGVQLGLIVSVNRHEPFDLAEHVIQLAADRMDEGIHGVDLAGDELAGASDPYTRLFAQAKQAGLKLTIHAGEWGGPENIAHAIEAMGADRIGHGVRIMEDAGVLHLARTTGVGFEISPTSNILTGVFDEYEAHPLPRMIDAGLRVVISSDDPSIFNTTLAQEHALAVEHLGLSLETLKGLAMQAIQLSFIDDKEKRKMEGTFAALFWG